MISTTVQTKVHLTRTERKILRVVSDGKPHTREELRACLLDQRSQDATVAVHLTGLRKKINPMGLDIICVWHRRQRKYQWVKLLHGKNNSEPNPLVFNSLEELII